MGLTMQGRHATVRELAPVSQKACKSDRSRMLDEFTRLTGYTGSYAAFVLRPPLAHNSSWMHKYLWFFLRVRGSGYLTTLG
jgi:hypothetical protein